MVKTVSPRNYGSFLISATKKQWQRIGLKRRAGVAAALFSLRTRESLGVGEIPDLKAFIDWCHTTGLSIIQLLPLNDVGFDFTPYDSQSNFALDPMYLALNPLRLFKKAGIKSEVTALRKKFPVRLERVNYAIKGEKLRILWKIFEKEKGAFREELGRFVEVQKSWIEDYAVFKVMKSAFGESSWQSWEAPLKDKQPEAVKRFCSEHSAEIEFQKWLQWQLFEQFADVKKHAESKGVLLMGDLPFLVSRDSADVWSHQDYFKLDLSAGAPPDLYFANGQRWGMPPYDWGKMAQHGYDYQIQKLKFAENFYDFFRIDHAVGLFRVWTIPLHEPSETGGMNGAFDPPEEAVWEDHGKKLFSLMISNTKMVPCAEDLGTVPDCSYKVLKEFAIPGMDVQRWSKDWEKTFDFKQPEEYRKNSIAVISTHDMTTLRGWWKGEIDTVDEALFARLCGFANLPFENVKTKLFDPGRSYHGRLRWKNEISDEKKLLEILARPEEEVQEILKTYRGTYGESLKFWRYLGMTGPCSDKMTPVFARRILEKACQTASIFSIQLLQDWLAMEKLEDGDPWDDRVNVPGLMSERNWSWCSPYFLEELQGLKRNADIKELVKKTDRL
ncbi:MAG: 4-alpha-glucanotransferase [Candidatus Omnitrophica bacterium]|nr:4-alpha-glucanotransferase [Candidatus Omnitrophota bacterium]